MPSIENMDKPKKWRKRMLYQALLAGLVLTSCTPAEVMIAEEIAHEASVAENAIEADLMGAEAPDFNRPRVDDRTAVKKPAHDDYTRPNGRKNKQI